MKWPDDPNLPPDIVARLNQRIEEFLDADRSTNGGANAAAVRALVLDLFSIHQSCVGEVNKVSRQSELELQGLYWDTDEPNLAHVQKYINRLFAGQLENATEYIDRAINERASADAALVKDTMVRTGGRGGTAKRTKTSPIIEVAMLYYRENHQQYKTKKDAARHLEGKFPPVAYSTYYRKLRNLKN